MFKHVCCYEQNGLFQKFYINSGLLLLKIVIEISNGHQGLPN